MNVRQENKLSMFLKIRAFFSTNLSGYSSVTMLAGLGAEFNSLVDDIFTNQGIAGSDNSGYSEQKLHHRESIRQKTLMAAGAFMSIGNLTHNVILRGKGAITETALRNLSDNDELVFCLTMLEVINENTAALLPYGIDAAFIADYDLSATLLSNSIKGNDDQKEIKAEAVKEVRNLMMSTHKLLKEQIDPVMKITKMAQPVLYDTYKILRHIDDRGGSHSKPDISISLGPKAYTVVTTLSYLPHRSFKVRNKSAHTIHWGLSNDAGTFTNNPQIIKAKSISTKQSSTLAPNGDILLFQNTSEEVIDVEVRILV